MAHPATRPEARRGRPSLVDAAFQQHRHTITALYCDENKSLPDVMELMRNEYGFSATIKQYKDRLTAWKLSKNIRRHEMPHLARIKTRRDAVGKKTRLKLRGAAIDSSKVDRWIRTQRKKMGDEEFISSLATDASTPPDIGYETPDDHDSDDNDTTPSRPEILDTQNKAISESTASSTLPSPPTRPKAFRLIEKFEDSSPLVHYIYQDNWDLSASGEPRTTSQSDIDDLPNPVFEVSVSPLQLSFEIFSKGLLSDLCTALSNISSQINELFDGTLLLAHFSNVKTHLRMLECDDLVGSDRTEELALLVYGCLENLSVYRCFGRPHIEGNACLDDEIRRILGAQELDDSIDAFDQAFLAVDYEEKYNSRDTGKATTSNTEERANQPWMVSFDNLHGHEQPHALREKVKAAVKLGDVDAILDGIYDLYFSDREGETDWPRFSCHDIIWLRPLMIHACGHGYEVIVRLFLQLGAEVTWELDSWLASTAPGVEYDENKTTPIIEACKAGHHGIIEMLLSVQETSAFWVFFDRGSTWLHGAFIAALRCNQLEVARKLRHKVSQRAELLVYLEGKGEETLHEQACELLFPSGSALTPVETLYNPSRRWMYPSVHDWANKRRRHILPSFRKLQKRKLLDFRLSFIHQYSLLQLAVGSSQISEQLTASLSSYRDMWDTAMSTMSSIGRGYLPETDSAAMAILCVSRALAETATPNTIGCLDAFDDDLNKWAHIFPAVGEVAEIMWGTSTSITSQNRFELPWNPFLPLRDFTTALVEEATQFFALRGDCNRGRDLDGHPRQQCSDTDPGEDPAVARAEKPPDRLILPEATRPEADQAATGGGLLVSSLVAGIIFALVVLFIIAFSRPTSNTVLGFPNPWLEDTPQPLSIDPSAAPEQSQSAGSEPGLMDPMLLSRPSTPLFQNWEPDRRSLPAVLHMSSTYSEDLLLDDGFLRTEYQRY